MGIIARQGIKRSLISALGVFIGILSVMFVYPLAKDAYGYAGFIYSTATIFSLMLGLGSSGLVIKYFPEFKKENSSGYLGIVLSYAFVNIIVITLMLLLISIIFKDSFTNLLIRLEFDVDLINDNIITIYFLAIIIILIRFFIYHSANFKRIVVPTIIVEFGYKIFLPIVIFSFYKKVISMNMIPILLFFFYSSALIANLIYIKYLGGFSISRKSLFSLPKAKIKQMYKYMGFSGLNSLSVNISTHIDKIMIPMLTSLAGAGIYSILMFMSNSIAIPSNSLNQIASPIISESIENNNFENIDQIYKKTSINSFILGVILFIIIWTILPNIIEIMPSDKDFSPFLYVFFFLGLAKLFDMLTSVNTYIIIYSKYYRYNLYFLLFLAIMNLILNYFLILKYGITGAAFATMTSMLSYNILKFTFIKIKFNLSPFNFDTIKILSISSILFLISLYLPNSNLVLINLAYKPIFLILLFYLLIKLFKLNAEIIELGESIVSKILKKVF